MSLEQLMDVVGLRVRQEMQAYGPSAAQPTQANEMATVGKNKCVHDPHLARGVYIKVAFWATAVEGR